MALILTIPSAVGIASMEWGPRKAGVQFASPYNGAVQAIDLLAERWVLSLATVPCKRSNAGAYEALFGQLAGGVNRLRTHHIVRPQPLGTMRGTPTLSGAVARGAAQLTIQTTAAATLKAGDFFGCSGQVFQAAADATANGSGVMTVTLVLRARAAMSNGAAVVWDRPTADFAMPKMDAPFSHMPKLLGGGQYDLLEVW